MTRSIIPILRQSGVRAVSVGVNDGSAPPAVPRQFRWLDPISNTSVFALWHAGGYGFKHFPPRMQDLAVATGTGHALAPCFKGDNQGPPDVQETLRFFAALRTLVPGATVRASTWDEFLPFLERADLPVVSQEIGDTWICMSLFYLLYYVDE